jgi:hypothetical protein
MINKTSIYIFLFWVLLVTSVFSQTDSISKVNIKYYDLDIELTRDNSNFFTGNMVVRRKGADVFRMDSTFSSFVDYRLVDLNNDGSKELLLFLSEGASPYVFHNLYIFDSKRDVKPLFIVTNGEVDTTFSNPKIIVDSRMSPSVLGLWYSWYLEYKNGKLVYWKPDNATRSKLGPDYEYVNNALSDLKKENQICDDFAYDVFFEYIFITAKIAGDESTALDYFENNYKCPEKIKALGQFRNYASDNFNWIKKEENYIYTEF